MKILLINDYASLVGGAEVIALTLRDGLREYGHDARLFTSRARPDGGPSVADYTCFGTTSGWRTAFQCANVAAWWRLRQVLAEFQPDVVHVMMFLTQLSPLILPLLRSRPSIYQVNWYRPICPRGTKMLPHGTMCTVPAGIVCLQAGCVVTQDWPLVMAQMGLWQCWQSAFDLIVPISETVRRRLSAHGIQATAPPLIGTVPRSPRRPLADPPLVACAARLTPEKGVDVLLRAFATVHGHQPKARLVIAGDGPERNHLESLAVTLGLGAAVRFLGHLSRTEMEKALETAWVQVVPSRWSEPYGIVALEAMMRGTAVIASGEGGLAEIVQPGQTGLLVPPGDHIALGETLLTLVNDRKLAERMGRASHTVALARYTIQASVEYWLPIYATLIKRYQTKQHA